MIHHDPLTNEPYIRLPPPLSHIILTPPRLTHTTRHEDSEKEGSTPPAADIQSITNALNNPLVFPWLESPPYPYLPLHAESIIRSSYAEAQDILRSADTCNIKKGGWVDGCPFRDIRDTSSSVSTLSTCPEGSTDESESIKQARKIGDCKISRYAFYEFAHGSNERRDAQMRNEALESGDGAVEWGVGFWLAPSHHRQGIMSAVLQTLISEWAVPRMNACTIGACVFTENAGSRRTLEKCGFVFQETIIQGSVEMSEAKGGGRRDLHVLKWRRNA